MEDSIKAGLNGPADGPASSAAAAPGLRTVVGVTTAKPAPGSATAGATGRATADAAGPATVDAAPDLAETLEYLPGRLADWATHRDLAPNSATGIAFVLGVCAAVWFSGGTRPDDAKAAMALCGSYIAGWAAQLLIRPLAGIPGAAARAADGSAASAAVGPASWPADGRAVSAGQLARLTSSVCEYAVYAGLAIGAQGARWSGAWELATAAMILLAVRQTIWACGGPAASATRSRQILSGSGRRILAPAGAGRLALIAVVAPVWGARTALLALLAWGLVAAGYAMTSRLAADPAADGTVRKCRDDGEIAHWLGRLVRGNLAALPPALAGLAATATLALLGLQNLPGVLVLTPVVAMLLAAPGSAATHTGPLDWLVPALLQAGQFLYLAALGFRCGVPAPVTFGLCAVIALRSTMLAGPGWPVHSDRPEPGAGLGWEGRMLVAGLGVLAGLATFAYAALTAYLGVLICSKVMTSRRGVSR